MVSFDVQIMRANCNRRVSVSGLFRSNCNRHGQVADHQSQRPRDERVAAPGVPSLHGAEPDPQRAGLLGARAEGGQEGGEGLRGHCGGSTGETSRIVTGRRRASGCQRSRMWWSSAGSRHHGWWLTGYSLCAITYHDLHMEIAR